jgi:hypothetical protein
VTEATIESFVIVAREFCALVERDREPNSWIFAQKCLVSLLRLYEKALHLPSAEVASGYEFVERIDTHFWTVVMTGVSQKLAQDYYWMIHESFEPFGQPAPEAVIGQLSDDLADIWRDVKTGLQELDRGGEDAVNAAVWCWRFRLETHWGTHASTAIVALTALCYGPYADASRPTGPGAFKILG